MGVGDSLGLGASGIDGSDERPDGAGGGGDKLVHLAFPPSVSAEPQKKIDDDATD